MKRQPTQTWWEAITYTAEDGKTTRSRELHNAIIDLYGTQVFYGNIRERRNENKTLTHKYVDVYSRKEFNKSGASVKVGRVTWKA
jgi:hypothetical protein